jgi:hypothetical protein
VKGVGDGDGDGEFLLDRDMDMIILKMLDHANREPGVEGGLEKVNGEMNVRGRYGR